MRRIVTSLLIGLLFISVPAGAQTLGTITGEVKDTSGAVIPGANVSAQNRSTNATREVQSNETGSYSFPALPPGPYVVRVELQGFRSVTQNVDLHVEQTVRVGHIEAVFPHDRFDLVREFQRQLLKDPCHAGSSNLILAELVEVDFVDRTTDGDETEMHGVEAVLLVEEECSRHRACPGGSTAFAPVRWG